MATTSNEPENSLLFALELDGKGGATEYNSVEELQTVKKPAWFHFDANHKDTFSNLQKVAPEIDEHTLLAIFDSDARPRTLALEQGTLIILRGINLNAGQDETDMVAVRLWVTENRIVSTRYRRSRTVIDLAETLRKGTGPKTIGDVVSQAIVNLLGFIETTIGKLYDDIDEIEADILDEPDRELRKNIAEIRKSSILLRRYIAPQKEAISQLRFAELPWLTTKNLRRVQEAQDNLLRNIEDLDAIRERAQVVKDELVNALSDKLNRNLYLLSVVTAIFLPLGFLTGLFGINIGGMPGVEKDYAFAMFSSALLILVVFQIGLFKLLRWF